MPLDSSSRPTLRRFAWPPIRAALVVALVAPLALPGLSAVAHGSMLRNPGKLVPPDGVLMGAFVNPRSSPAVTPAQHRRLVRRFESMIGRRLDVEMWYYRWGKDFWNNVPSWDLATGRIPLVKYGAGGSSPRLDSIIDGSHDSEIRALAAGSRSMRKPFFFAPFWEMNGSWEPWNGVHTSDPGTHNGPMKYIRAWRRMHDIFVRQGVRNAVWVWSPDRGDVPREPWNHWWRYYPGDAYVDWVGMDGYNWGTAADWSSWRSWEDVFRPLYLDFASRKPVMVAETASAERGGHKARWIRNARAAIKARFPQLGAVVWFHDDKETDWRVNSSRRSLAAYRAWVHDPYFNVGAEPASITFRAAYRLGRALRRGVAASVGSMRSFRVVLRARLRRRTARRFGLSAASTVVARGRAAVTIPGTRRVRLRFSRPAQRRLREARRVSVHVSARVFERGGSTKTRQAFALVR